MNSDNYHYEARASANYHYEARASPRCHTQLGRHQGCVVPKIHSFRPLPCLRKLELKHNIWLFITLVKIIRLNPRKFRFEIDNEGQPPEFVADCGLLPLPLDIFQFRMCQNNHLLITDPCGKFYVNQW